MKNIWASNFACSFCGLVESFQLEGVSRECSWMSVWVQSLRLHLDWRSHCKIVHSQAWQVFQLLAEASVLHTGLSTRLLELPGLATDFPSEWEIQENQVKSIMSLSHVKPQGHPDQSWLNGGRNLGRAKPILETGVTKPLNSPLNIC
jgi:hypothetical protein